MSLNTDVKPRAESLTIEARDASNDAARCARGAAAPPAQIRVLFVNDHLGYEGGVVHGVTRYFLNVIPRFDPQHVDAKACFLRGPHPAAGLLRDRGIEPLFLDRAKADPRALWDLAAIARRLDIDILHLAGMKSILLGRIAARLAGCRAVIHLHDTQTLGRWLGFAQRRLARWTHAALAVSDPVRRLAIDEFGIDPACAETLHNGVSLDEFAAVPADARNAIRREFDIDADAPVVGIVGRLSAEKGHLALLAAWSKLRSAVPRAVLLVVGDGPLRAECEAVAARCGITDSVRFAGQRVDVPALLAAMDLAVVPSTREGFGYTAVEASAAGVPVVAFRVGGLPEVVADGVSGILVEPGDLDAVVEAMTRVLTDARLAARLGEGGRRMAGRFSIDAHVRRLHALYGRLRAATRGNARPSARGLD